MPETEDRIEFNMVNGEIVWLTRPAGQGRVALNATYEERWVSIDETNRIRPDKIVSIKLWEHTGGDSGQSAIREHGTTTSLILDLA